MIPMECTLFSCLIFWFLCPYITSSASQLCGGRDGIVCCSGYQWNEAQRNCTRCMDGFYSRNCTIPCPYPRFGWRCRLECMCSSEDCHHVYGCRRSPSDCATGKYGKHCEFFCLYPNHGNECQLVCHCDEVFCDPSSRCAEDYSSLHNTEISTAPASASSTIYNEAATETAPKSTNILHLDKMCDEKSADVNESNSTSLIAGIISLLVVVGMLLIVYAMTYFHKVTCIVQGDTASKSIL